MTAFSTVVQTVIYDKLATDIPLSLAIKAVYDDVPQPNDSGDPLDFPYLAIGEDVITDTSTDLELMADASITIHSWSRYSGRSQIKEIQGLVYDALNRANLIQSGYKIININNVSTESQLDSDGFTRHGVQTFKLMIEEI